jgi:hypothetical protein
MADTSALAIALELELSIGEVQSERARKAIRAGIERLRELQRINADLRIRNAVLEVAEAMGDIPFDRDAN